MNSNQVNESNGMTLIEHAIAFHEMAGKTEFVERLKGELERLKGESHGFIARH